MICNLRSANYGGKLLILFKKHSLLNVTLMGVWILLMLVFTLTSPFLFRVALPWPLIPALGIALSIILSVLIVRVIGLLLRQALLK